MPLSAYAPELSIVTTSTHITGWLPMIFIMREIRGAKPTFDPPATLSTSLVPMAMIQQP